MYNVMRLVEETGFKRVPTKMTVPAVRARSPKRTPKPEFLEMIHGEPKQQAKDKVPEYRLDGCKDLTDLKVQDNQSPGIDCMRGGSSYQSTAHRRQYKVSGG
ncbi:hypothetical protein NDU88_004592 [Pleurodeles waltl]|uniref:Uncharacterized protein n=1 Tax=Pleurodeles waltl TaxID=8319 RepID=A0AAV7TRX6_PLEWA|nr:hypothetical protein NDU88_004592 [Pleurodeles waltl]